MIECDSFPLMISIVFPLMVFPSHSLPLQNSFFSYPFLTLFIYLLFLSPCSPLSLIVSSYSTFPLFPSLILYFPFVPSTCLSFTHIFSLPLSFFSHSYFIMLFTSLSTLLPTLPKSSASSYLPLITHFSQPMS